MRDGKMPLRHIAPLLDMAERVFVCFCMVSIREAGMLIVVVCPNKGFVTLAPNLTDRFGGFLI
jgi:hypothetical protein